METVSKFTLNPLATCFIPSSMKHQSMTCAVFSVPSYETLVNEHIRTGQLPIITNKQNTATDFLQVVQVQSNPVKEKILDPFVTIEELKETLPATVKEVFPEEPLLETKRVFSAVNQVSIRETPVKSNDGKTSEQIFKRICPTDTSLTKLDISLPNQTIMGKIAKLLKGGIKTFWMLLPFEVRSLFVIEFFCRMGLRTMSLKLTTTSHMCSVLKPNFFKITFPKHAKKTNITKRKVKRVECHCPPMFGWIIPLQFFGNPLKLPETCRKDYVHTNYVNESSRQSEHSYESSVNNETFTLNQYSSELKAVIKDVCDFLSWIEQNTEEDNPVSKIKKRPVWETEKKHLALDIIDDGIHPLLQEVSTVNSDDTEIKSIQALLEEAFSCNKVPSGQEILPSQSVCNPPCSVWCNKVPPPAKDAYKRFIKKMDSESAVRHKVTGVEKETFKKPLYKRCLSSDDTSRASYDKIPLLSASSFESKERLLLLHKDPVSFIKQSSTSALKDVNHKSRSRSSVISEQVATKNLNENGSNKWCTYYGADSMWQPLPDCIPSYGAAQNQSHKKIRDVRRQRSIC